MKDFVKSKVDFLGKHILDNKKNIVQTAIEICLAGIVNRWMKRDMPELSEISNRSTDDYFKEHGAMEALRSIVNKQYDKLGIEIDSYFEPYRNSLKENDRVVIEMAFCPNDNSFIIKSYTQNNSNKG